MAILDGLQMLSDLSDQQRSELEVFCQQRVLQKGEQLFAQGDEANAIYFLKDGTLSIDAEIDGISRHLGHASAEEVIGEMALFGGATRKRMATVTALSDAHLVVILSFSMEQITQQNPELLEKITEIIELRNIANKSKGLK